ncbi:LPS export ABC transporter periplasmic protein LptC [Candidatus Thiothrix anitrata]|uniref:LPS export ABC transporter periplasmic protein LptC n=1 Tax=Candidatus Thiothrix anitrata TaxID=2823902 RepID=A0ABX7X7V1_9GAMM|nr:LPS export ABC transporter periplasmic protein LptC [Candidatus Thiothrix anitrata]QTR49770.1 LPS export ABC transporter periplasmic protein LptC [Candidatus Thiothrix anitrata]
MKAWIILIAALCLILVITQMEDYFGQQYSGGLASEKDHVDYYFVNFALMETQADGTISQQVSGKHLTHWKLQKQSTIIAPVISDGIDPQQRVHTLADTAQLNQQTQQARLQGNVHSYQATYAGQGGFDLYTDHLDYDLKNRVASTDANVNITTSSGAIQAVGMNTKLDEDLLRFNANVRSTYSVK